jgi:hypothetical protein
MKHFLCTSINTSREGFERVAYVCWRMVEEEVEDDGKGVDNDTQDVAPPPLEFGIKIQCSCNWRTEYRKGNRCR